MTRPAALLLVALVAGACASPTDPSFDVSIQTSEAAYTWSPSPVAVAYTVTNAGSAPVNLTTCGDHPLAAVERLLDGEWVPGNSLACIAILRQVAIVVSPDGAADFSVHLLFPEPGSYRLRLGVHTSPQHLAWSGTSNRFEVL
jgi:hypothetical protein